MRVIGITGGVGAGKSRILELLKQEYGAETILTDQVAKELEEPGEPGYLALLDVFGDKILSEDGTIDRNGLAKIMFRDPKALKAVNEIIHPMTWNRVREQVAASGSQLIAVESALFEKKADFLDELWYVYTSETNRFSRLGQSRGYDRKKSLDIIKNQPSEEQFFAMADRVIDNNGSLEEVREQLKHILEHEG